MKCNKIVINYKKSNFVVFGWPGNCYPWISLVEAGGLAIWRTSSVCYLGIIVDESLIWRSYLESLKYISKNIGIILKFKHSFRKFKYSLLYFNLVHPYNLYCTSIWLRTFSSILRPVRVLQNIVMRILVNLLSSESCREAYFKSKILDY